jgi:hypothetical protein
VRVFIRTSSGFTLDENLNYRDNFSVLFFFYFTGAVQSAIAVVNDAPMLPPNWLL